MIHAEQGFLNFSVGLYESDGKCHNAEPGTYGHECGKPAQWIGETASGFRSGFCDDCRKHGSEAKRCIAFRPRSS